jgi:BirA family transcriptional regulator, biotin operon repressor / biotin---[acetyl-CoA-carboxylase] ligase
VSVIERSESTAGRASASEPVGDGVWGRSPHDVVVEPAAIPPRDCSAGPSGWTVEHVAETGSTNADLLATAASRPDRSVLVADHQTAGRGRLDRRWDAPAGANLLVSLLFHVVPDDPGELTRRVGLATVDACRESAGVIATLKWPNDVLVGDRKLAGILGERSATGAVVVGLGLNVRWAPDGAALLGPSVEPLAVLDALLAAYDRLPADITARYRRELATLGWRVRIELATGSLDGTATDVDPDGRLVVLDACGITQRVDAGDVVHVR